MAGLNWPPAQFSGSFTSAAVPKKLSNTDSGTAGRPIADIYNNLSSDSDSQHMY